MDNVTIFEELEKVLNEKINADVIQILLRCGFDSKIAISNIDKESMQEIEKYGNEDRSVLQGTTYENMEKFVLKPGHKLTIFHLANKAKSLLKATVDETMQLNTSQFSFILKTFIETAQSNTGRAQNGYRYNDINRYFSTFVYLFCGKSCYETLSANLPIPSVNSIRKFPMKNCFHLLPSKEYRFFNYSI